MMRCALAMFDECAAQYFIITRLEKTRPHQGCVSLQCDSMRRVHCSAKRVKYAISRACRKTPNDSMSDSEVAYRHLEDDCDLFRV